MRHAWALCAFSIACGAAPISSEVPSNADPIEPAPDAGVESEPADAGSVDAGDDPIAPPDPVEADDAGVQADDGGAEAALLRLGRRAYDDHCDLCHEDGPRLIGRALGAARVRRQVRQGGGHMRPIPVARLADRDLNAIIAFLRSTSAR